MNKFEKQIYDVLVIGGGMAGTFAAIAAGEAGKKVLIVEKNQCLGGTSTSSMVSELMGVAFHGRKIYGGAVQRYFDTLESNGHAMYNYNVPMSSNPNVHIDRLRCNPEYAKIYLEKMALEANADILYDAVLVQAEESDDCIECVVKTAYTELTVQCSFLIDATGNASVACKMGLPTFKNDSKALQTSTLIIRLGNIEIEKLQETIKDKSIQKAVRKGFDSGILKGRILGFAPIPNTNDTTVNVVNTNIDHEDPYELTKGLIDTHQQVPSIIDFIRENVKGCEHAVLVSIGSTLGIRDARRLVGTYELTFDDLKNSAKFEDCAALGCYPLDIHDPVTNTVIWEEVKDLYQIPFRTMYCKESKRVIVTGRAVSASRDAFAAIRVMPSVMNLGEASGCLAAVLVEDHADLSDFNIEHVKELMKQRKMNVE
ncbi:MAG: FAD-dependent oxidoreductase [Solobacterium sp.]|nr:FAD-dependent oxidoreductase [Solobacterium sp.]MBQ9152973.1 FAD-dependent oxidoreductase [Solobacterium sp.]